MNSKILGGISVVLIGAAFYGGMMYGKSTATAAALANRRNFQGGNQQGGGRTNVGNAGVNITGEILSKTDNTLTIKLRDGGSKIVVFSSSTPVRMFSEASRDQIEVGKNITALGTANSDGSITAQSIQLREVSSTPAGFQGGSPR
ncbi:MAG: hypothetical protein WC725_03555 [Patescibacteria group bacterium]|jgi:hypothetical protein